MSAVPVVVLVATRQRPALLRRALDSIGSQTLRPSVLVVVVDEPGAGETLPIPRTLLPRGVDTVVLHNRREPGAAGAWNTGLDEITRRFDDADAVRIAILDDDDWWESDHLARCLACALEGGFDIVAPRIVRHDDHDPEEGRLETPPALSADLALMRNTGIQGSNLFVRLSTLLEAGGFDESLRSTTDRDLVIRLADLGASFAPVRAATVHHDARGGRERLSTPGTPAKADGLRRFLAKYRHRMLPDQRTAFLERSSSFFGIDAELPPSSLPCAECSPVRTVPDACPDADPLHLVVGIATDGDAAGAARMSRLLGDLEALLPDPRLATLDVVLLENGYGGDALAAAVGQLERVGPCCRLVRVEDQHRDAAAGLFGPDLVRAPGRVGVADARTMVQRYVRFVAPAGAVAWILDDDKRLAPLTLRDGRLAPRERDTVGRLLALRDSGADIVLGIDTGAAPLPATMTLRVQLVDLQANLADLRSLTPDAHWPKRHRDDLDAVRSAPDTYYHDLARRPIWHLERPFGFVPNGSAATVRDTFLELCRRAPRLLVGEQVFRSLFVEAEAPLTLHPSVRRGGSTLFMDLDALVDVPQRAPVADGRPSRRSDAVAAILNVAARGRRVEEASFAVLHDRGDLEERVPCVDTLVDDVRGFAAYSTLRDLVAEGLDLERPMARFVAGARELHARYLRERTESLTASSYRARGAARSTRRTLTTPDAWWWTDPACAAAARELDAFLGRALDRLGPSFLDTVRHAIARTPGDAMERWLAGLGPSLAAAREFRPARPAWLVPDRVERARSVVERLSSPRAPLTLLGHGDEGVVFTDGRHAFKSMDGWSVRATAEDRLFLRSLIGAWSGTTCLIGPERLDEGAGDAVLVMPYVRGAPYRGGHGPGLAALLAECRERRVACRNLHPKNLLVVGEGVRLIDCGIDVRPLDDDEWRHMVRRAWLCWRWATHPDLDRLMTRALTEEPPEVDGWRRLERAVLAGDAKAELDALVLDAVLHGTKALPGDRVPVAAPIGRVLDYGCGSGALVARLADGGVPAVGYDPRRSPRWGASPNATFTTDLDEALANGPYDTVVCSLVLCTLDDAHYRRALVDLRAALRDGGRAIVAVCHPFHTRGGDTPFQRRIDVPTGEGGDDATFAWTKRVRGTGNARRDVHRPLHVLRRDLLRAGIPAEPIAETATVDLERFEPASDFLVLRGYALPPGPDVSLLVRASALEWRTLDVQVRHVVGQLETPRAFRERLVVLDTRADGFVRAHDGPDLAAARAALDRLVADGTIDRVIEGPDDPDDVRSLHGRWFGMRPAATHTPAGAPVASTLAGVEACAGKYVLHVDDDLMILRRDRHHDVLRELADVLDADERNVAASLNVTHAADRPWTKAGPDGPWRIEARGTLLHRERLLASRPWPNAVRDDAPVLSWHRSLDRACAERGLRSLRGGSAAFGFVHPPNAAKADRLAWFAVLDQLERGRVPDAQLGRVDLVDAAGWLGPPRREPMVVVACGRNVPAGRVARFRDSIEAQSQRDTGLVVVEDGGSRTARDVVGYAFAGRPRTTLLTPLDRRGALANLVAVLRHVCPDPRTVIVLVDLDDALLGPDALSRVATVFEKGHDLAVGGMRRTDKAGQVPPRFDDSRSERGGAVWQHLRAFRRSLFDRVPDAALRDDDGRYFDLASDWALMIALAELADAPCALPGTLYLHEPSGQGKSGSGRDEREAVIARVLARASLRDAGA